MRDKHLLSESQCRRMRGRLDQLKRQLARLDWLCPGSITHVPPAAWHWTRKVRGKTVTVAVSGPQAALLCRAIASQKKARHLLAQIHALSQEYLLRSVPDVLRRQSKNDPKVPLS